MKDIARYHYFDLIVIKMTNAIMLYAEKINQDPSIIGSDKKEIEQNVLADEVEKTIRDILEDRRLSTNIFIDAWNDYKFGTDKWDEWLPEIPPISIEENFFITPSFSAWGIERYITNKETLKSAIAGCLYFTYMEGFEEYTKGNFSAIGDSSKVPPKVRGESLKKLVQYLMQDIEKDDNQ